MNKSPNISRAVALASRLESTQAQAAPAHTPEKLLRDMIKQDALALVSDYFDPAEIEEAIETIIAERDQTRAACDALLAALRWIATRLDIGGKAARSDAQQQARAAIARAEEGK